MKFFVLGALAIANDTEQFTPSAPKVREVLSLLLLRHNQLIPTRDFIDELWGDKPPTSAHSTLQTYVYKLRKLLAKHSHTGTGNMLVTRQYGYEIIIAPETLDLCQFEQLTDKGIAMLGRNDLEGGTETLSEALSLWRGSALADVNAGRLLSAYIIALEEKRLRALELRLDADLQLGRHREVISELRTLIWANPLHEEFHAKLMVALHRCDRRSEALHAYRHLREVLLEELGVDPSSAVRELHQALLSSDPSLDLSRSHAPISVECGPVAPPAHLPPDVADFTGRARELDQAIEWLVRPASGPGIVSITGMPGVGKTAFAVHAAHRIRKHFPDGQFFVDLKGSTDEHGHPSTILYRMLRAIGISDGHIPATLVERNNLFRTWSADRRILVMLDDAASTDQVQPLLPSSPRSAVLLCQRTGLHDLPGAHVMRLDVLPVADSVTLLAKIVGPGRVARDSHGAETIVRQCGCLPLAIRAAAARLVAARGWSLNTVASRLACWRTRLDELCPAGFDLRRGFDSSYFLLDDVSRDALRKLSLFGTQKFTIACAARLLNRNVDTVDTVLARLVEHHFLQVHDEGDIKGLSFAFHELARIHARSYLHAELGHRGDWLTEIAVRIDEVDLDT
ncbi:MAG: BTAD domain-containing putative transcriptional regulator [Pseudonocardiaceae bacterium]